MIVERQCGGMTRRAGLATASTGSLSSGSARASAALKPDGPCGRGTLTPVSRSYGSVGGSGSRRRLSFVNSMCSFRSRRSSRSRSQMGALLRGGTAVVRLRTMFSSQRSMSGLAMLHQRVASGCRNQPALMAVAERELSKYAANNKTIPESMTTARPAVPTYCRPMRSIT